MGRDRHDDGRHTLKTRQLIGTAPVPDGGELRLFQRGDEYIIALGGNELMSSRMSGSEEALATMTCARLLDLRGARLLVGGYGMGFTLRAALATLGKDAEVVVAELVPEIVDWARGPMAALAAGCLEDPRVEIVIGDVAGAITAATRPFDAILLDVDNGPDGLTRPSNDRLYAPTGLAAAKAALKGGGVLAIWSAAPDPGFTRRLAAAGFAVEETKVRARSNGKGAHHVIWFAKPS
jgi:spermidine synthase